MAANLQIRNVPEDLHRKLKLRAVQAGMSLSDYLLRELAAVARRPTIEELIARIERRDPVRVSVDPGRAVRAEREAR
jgi:plasmid stability protein